MHTHTKAIQIQRDNTHACIHTQHIHRKHPFNMEREPIATKNVIKVLYLQCTTGAASGSSTSLALISSKNSRKDPGSSGTPKSGHMTK